MKRAEKILLLVTAIVLFTGSICYAMNLDVYRAVDNMHPVHGYAEFVDSLSDEDFVLDNCDKWSASQSWVLRDLYNFLTIEDAQLNTLVFASTQAAVTFSFYYSFACVPFIVITLVRVHQRRKKGIGSDKHS